MDMGSTPSVRPSKFMEKQTLRHGHFAQTPMIKPRSQNFLADFSFPQKFNFLLGVGGGRDNSATELQLIVGWGEERAIIWKMKGKREGGGEGLGVGWGQAIRTLSRAEYERKWLILAEIGSFTIWPHWFLCGWACRGGVHHCCRTCMCAVLS